VVLVRESDKLQKLPFYLVCDVSYSMADENRIGAVISAIQDIQDGLKNEPLLSDLAYFSLITFADKAEQVIALGNMSERNVSTDTLPVGGGTNYSAAFELLRHTLRADVDELKQEFRVFRPTVFFLSDGAPQDTDDWPDSFELLTWYDPASGAGFKYYPMIVPFGIGEADPKVLAALVHPKDRSKLYMAKDGHSTAKAVTDMANGMLTSIVASAQTATGSNPQITLPGPKDVGPGIAVLTSDLEEL
jgi:uncharacterized protein YegL